MLSHYRLVEKVGEGGMGVVWKAFDVRLKRNVAIKFLHAGSTADAAARSRFRKEAQAAAAIVHPGIATVLGFEEVEGLSFIVMEFVPGRPLRSLLPGNPMPMADATRIAIEIADALAVAHRAGVVHRDLKPDNVIIDTSGRARILDFGLAKRFEDGRDARGGSTLSGSATQPGTVLGTIDYMAPEQVRGEAADARSDLFSLGCMMYEMVTGARPFRGATPVETMSAILNQAPVPPRTLNPAVRPAMERALLRCLEKDRASRHQSAGDLATALREIERSGPAAAAQLSRAHPVRWALGFAGLAAVAILILALGRGGMLDRLAGARAVRIESLAVLPLENLTGEAGQEYFANGMTEELIATLARIGSLRVISRTSVMPYKGVRKPLRQIGRELGVDAVIEGSVRRAGGRVRVTAQLIRVADDRHLWAESYDEDMRDVLKLQGDVALAIARQVQAELTPSEGTRLARAPVVNPEAHEAYLRGLDCLNRSSEADLAQAAVEFRHAIELEPDHALAHVGLSSYYVAAGIGALGPGEAIPKARAEAMRALEIDDGLAEAHRALATLAMHYDWNFAVAETESKRAVELSPNSADARSDYAWLLLIVGRDDEARIEYEKAAKLNPLDLEARSGPAVHAFYTRQYARAIERFRPILSAAPDMAVALALTGCSLVETKRYEEGFALLEKWLTTTGKDRSVALGALGYAYARAGRTADAWRILDELERLAQTTHVSPYFEAFVYGALGEKDRAFERLERSYRNREAYLAKLKMDPLMDPLRLDPRFADLVRRLGLPA